MTVKSLSLKNKLPSKLSESNGADEYGCATGSISTPILFINVHYISGDSEQFQTITFDQSAPFIFLFCVKTNNYIKMHIHHPTYVHNTPQFFNRRYIPDLPMSCPARKP